MTWNWNKDFSSCVHFMILTFHFFHYVLFMTSHSLCVLVSQLNDIFELCRFVKNIWRLFTTVRVSHSVCWSFFPFVSNAYIRTVSLLNSVKRTREKEKHTRYTTKQRSNLAWRYFAIHYTTLRLLCVEVSKWMSDRVSLTSCRHSIFVLNRCILIMI